MSVSRIALHLLAWLVAACPLATSGRAAPGKKATLMVQRTLGPEQLRLVRYASGRRALLRVDARGTARPVRCGKLTGAWGLWVTDVNGDRRPELVIALRKRARHDPVVENRPHVYTLRGHRCVPLWRGTRLAGRFEELDVRGDRLWALERIGRGRRRVALYRWRGFGYTVRQVLWRGRKVPARWKRRFRKAKR